MDDFLVRLSEQLSDDGYVRRKYELHAAVQVAPILDVVAGLDALDKADEVFNEILRKLNTKNVKQIVELKDALILQLCEYLEELLLSVDPELLLLNVLLLNKSTALCGL